MTREHSDTPATERSKARHTQHNTDYQHHFMEQAIAMALENVTKKQGGPFGAVIIKDGAVIGTGTNRVTKNNDPTAHAEIVAIRDACRHLGTFQLNGAALYSSCEPCPMCLSAIYWAGISKVYFANTRKDAASIGFDDSFIYKEIALPVDKRELPLVHKPMPSATDVLKKWTLSKDKIAY